MNQKQLWTNSPPSLPPIFTTLLMGFEFVCTKFLLKKYFKQTFVQISRYTWKNVCSTCCFHFLKASSTRYGILDRSNILRSSTVTDLKQFSIVPMMVHTLLSTAWESVRGFQQGTQARWCSPTELTNAPSMVTIHFVFFTMAHKTKTG